MPCGGSSRCGGSGGCKCYAATVTQANSDATANYHDYLSFDVPANDMAAGDIVEVTLPCFVRNLSGAAAFLVQELAWGGNVVATYPSDNFTPWKNGVGPEAYLYRLLFQRVDHSGVTDIWMSDLRGQWGPYSMGLGTSAPTAGTVNFNALNFGNVDFTVAHTVTLRARWTKAAGFFFVPLGAGAQLTPLSARVTRCGC